ncbi:MAG TPA: Na+/H+ antiporter [Gemmatimonadaceae bacterium]|nr:Na+/H+ antiporter [Gemmatimonadaceae bacterium]
MELVLGLLVVAVALGRLGKGIATPTPVLLVVAGLLLGVVSRFIPGLPPVALDPDIVFLVFLPPLLASAALDIPFGPFRANLRPITFLAVGLVLATMAAVGFVVHAVAPEIPLAAALALGAIVAPPDPVAATTVARSLGLPNRLVTILEGEGLVNDATALVAYQVAVTAATTGYFTWSEAGARFIFAGSVGVAAGLAVGWGTGLALRTLHDEVLETAAALLAPYLAYLLADRLSASGVLAAVTVGFFLQRRSSVPGDASARLVSRGVWETLIFLINGAVFILVGLEIGQIAAAGMPPGTLRAAALVSAVVIWVRLAWMFIVPAVLRAVLPVRREHGIPSVSGLAILGWAGMRGVVSLAVALSLPLRTASGEPFPARAEIILLTFGVIFATLVLQGLTLRPLVRALGMADPSARRRERIVARRAAISAAKRHIRKMRADGNISSREARQLRRSLTPVSPDEVDAHASLRRARSEVLEAERRVIHHLVQSGEIGDPTAQELEAALDIQTMGLHLQDEREKDWKRRNEEEERDT